jgi:hypothetical protein
MTINPRAGGGDHLNPGLIPFHRRQAPAQELSPLAQLSVNLLTEGLLQLRGREGQTQRQR